jgi:DNA-binding NtrC family response regulator
VKILVVDDHAELRQMTVQFLELLGHTAVQAQNGAEALQALVGPDAGIDLVLLDVQLGPSSGLTLAAELERARPGLPVLFMSGYGREEYLPEQDDRPGRRFIEKPFTLWALEAALAAVMAAG